MAIAQKKMTFEGFCKIEGQAQKYVRRHQDALKIYKVLPDYQKENITDTDPEIAVRLFADMNKNYASDTLDSYRKRFIATVKDYKAYLASPKIHPDAITQSNLNQAGHNNVISAESILADDVLNVRINASVSVKIVGLPPKLTQQEANKLCRLIAAYVDGE